MSTRARKFKGATAQIRRPEFGARFRNSREKESGAGEAAPVGTYKTELCNKFMESGRCPYGTRCQFAHGERELRRSKRTTDRRFKTQKCRNFHNHGTCRYGKRCQFIHDESEKELMAMRGEQGQQASAGQQSPHRSPSQSPCKSADTSPALVAGMESLTLDQKLLMKLGPALVRHDSFRKILSDVITGSDGDKGSTDTDQDTSDRASSASGDSDLSSSTMASVEAPNSAATAFPRPKRLNVFRRMCSDSLTDISNSPYQEPLSPYQRDVANSITDDRHGALSPHISTCA